MPYSRLFIILYNRKILTHLASLLFVSFILTLLGLNHAFASSSERSSVIVRYSLHSKYHAGEDSFNVNEAKEKLSRLISEDLQTSVSSKSKSEKSTFENIETVKWFKTAPLVSFPASKELLLKLDQDNAFTVFPDKLHRPSIARSVPRIYSSRNSYSYHGGNQWAVAIIDTGVEKSHPFLSGKVVSEACYSGGGGQPNTQSFCPNGALSSTSNNSGLPCPLSGCEHGTQVSGVAVGNGNGVDGVARDAKLISVQVYSRINDESFCFPDISCIGAYTSDIISGLEHIYDLRNQFSIASVSVALGSDELFSGICDDQPEKPIIDLLRGSKIAVIAASGNSGNTSRMQSPACISSTIAVAATGSTNDVPWVRNNISNSLDFFAPGVGINSSALNGSFTTDTGTSLAVAHAAGAWTVIKHAKPSFSVNQITQEFSKAGPIVIQNGVKRRRLNVTGVLKSLFPDNDVNVITDLGFLPAVYLLLNSED